MTSRERILSSIAHKQPDRVPIDLGASTVTGISAIAYNRLKSALGLAIPTRVFDVVQQLSFVDDPIIDAFSVDAIDLNRVLMEDMEWYPVSLGDGSKGMYPSWFKPEESVDGSFVMRDHGGRVMSKMAKNGTCFDQTVFPWEQGYPDQFDSISEAFKSISWTAHSHTKYINIGDQELRTRAKKLHDSSDKAIVMSGGAKLLELGFFLRRMDNMLMDLLADHENLSSLLDKLMDLHLAGLEKKIGAVGDLVDVIRFGDDLGMTTGPFMDLDVFRKFFKPRYKELCAYVKQHSNLKIFLHSCGSIRQFMPDLIEAGFDIINPVQTNCFGMDASELKAEFGSEITFWGGGIDTSSVLPTGSTEEVRRDVLERCDILSRNGGFVFAPIHNILPEVPPENVIAAYEAVREFNGG
ncbi:MAG: methyltransferase [Bacteroidales bacterium]|nr:methyltransferase [Bacteroidales bacterium]